MRIVKIGALFLILLFLCMCGINKYELRLQIQGKVTDATSGSPIRGAKVELCNVTFQSTVVFCNDETDSQGQYSLQYDFDDENDCHEKYLVLSASKDPYNTKYYSYDVLLAKYVCCEEGVQTFDFQLNKF